MDILKTVKYQKRSIGLFVRNSFLYDLHFNHYSAISMRTGTADQLEFIDVHSLSIQFPVSTLQQNFGIA